MKLVTTKTISLSKQEVIDALITYLSREHSIKISAPAINILQKDGPMPEFLGITISSTDHSDSTVSGGGRVIA